MDRNDTPPLLPEHVQDYPRPPRIEPVPQRLRVIFAGRVVAETTRGLRVLETHHPPTYYFPPEDVLSGALHAVQGTSFCEWKGRATYFDLRLDGLRSGRAAWCYAAPTRDFAALAGFPAFYPERVEAAFVGDVPVTNQPGSFYGGWVTPNLTGLIKGGPGTEGW